MINAVIAGMVSVLLNIYFIKIWGLLGAGVAVLVSYLVSAFLNFTYKVKGVDNVDFKRFFKVFVYAILIGFITCSLINVLLNYEIDRVECLFKVPLFVIFSYVFTWVLRFRILQK